MRLLWLISRAWNASASRRRPGAPGEGVRCPRKHAPAMTTSVLAAQSNAKTSPCEEKARTRPGESVQRARRPVGPRGPETSSRSRMRPCGSMMAAMPRLAERAMAIGSRRSRKTHRQHLVGDRRSANHASSEASTMNRRRTERIGARDRGRRSPTDHGGERDLAEPKDRVPIAGRWVPSRRDGPGPVDHSLERLELPERDQDDLRLAHDVAGGEEVHAVAFRSRTADR